jgi:biotin operon repressor
MIRKSVGFSYKSSPISKKGKISYLLSSPFPVEEVILGKRKDEVLRFLYNGFKTANAISKEIGIKRTTVKQHLDELQNIGLVDFERDTNGKKKYAYPYSISEKGKFLIEKSVGFPVKSSRKGQLQGDNLTSKKTYTCRGHGYTVSVITDEKFDWKKILNELKIEWTPVTYAEIPRIIHNGRKIWLGNNKITFWFQKDESFFAKNPIKSRKSAEQEFYEEMESLMERVGFEFTYRFKFITNRTHNGFVDNEQAKSFKSKNQVVIVKDDKGEWLRYDFSQKKFVEGEVTRDDEDLNVSTAFQKFENANKKDGFLTARPDNLKKKFIETDKRIDENMKEVEERFKDLSKRDFKVSEQNVRFSQVLEQLYGKVDQMNGNLVRLTKIVIDKK